MSGSRRSNGKGRPKREQARPGTEMPPEKEAWDALNELKRRRRRKEEELRRIEDEADDFPDDDLDPLAV